MVFKKKRKEKHFFQELEAMRLFQCYTWDYIKLYFSNYYFVFASQYISKVRLQLFNFCLLVSFLCWVLDQALCMLDTCLTTELHSSLVLYFSIGKYILTAYLVNRKSKYLLVKKNILKSSKGNRYFNSNSSTKHLL